MIDVNVIIPPVIVSSLFVSAQSNEASARSLVEYRETDELGRLVEGPTALQRHETFYCCIQVGLSLTI